MVHDKLEFSMPADCSVVFDVFHYHCWRARWDTLVDSTQVEGGAPCPYVGATSTNGAGGYLRMLSMRTRFVSYERPKIAAANMVGRAFPFLRWAASMRHQALAPGRSLLIYTYTYEVGPASLRWLIQPLVKRIFDRQTRRRFQSMQVFLQNHSAEVQHWQQTIRPTLPDAPCLN